MLEIKNIYKKYKTGDLVQVALNGVSLNLRDNEFVAILGPSGSGKTTLLNIIGGLDRYDSGDLIINGISTKKYKARDWDTYRNHTIGFVFQSYNLIPHQTILSNVELALTIAGISKRERKQRALQALEEVGLKDQAHKRPNQMSGGQMQRVAIARALVNNPDILLADEPTGALDTKTSIQVMDLLKQVAKDRLVVMVTHNPDLANEYANRIVNLKDGEILSDSNPYTIEEVVTKKKNRKKGKAKMGIFTAFALSFNNLLTKKGRTFLTAFAGSIGIIGIALILSLSQGFQNYIDKIQEDTLSSYPLTITSETADMTSAILSMVTDHEENKVEGDKLIERQYLTTMFSSIGTNDLKSFKAYLEDNYDEIKNDVSSIKYTYSITPVIYTIDAADNLAKLNPNSLLDSMYSSSATSYISSISSSSSMGIFSELNEDYQSYADQYEILAGRWPSNYDEMIIVLSEPNSISDLLLYSLGLRDTDEMRTLISDVMSNGETDIENEPMTMTYDDLLNIDLRLIQTIDTYKYNSKYGIYEDMSDDDEYMKDLYNNALRLKVVGVMCAKEGNSTSAMSTGVNYTRELTQYVINQAKQSTIVKAQLLDSDIDVFSGKSFDVANEDSKKDSELDFNDMVSIDEDKIKDAFKVNISEDDFVVDEDAIAKGINDAMNDASNTITGISTGIMSLNSAIAQQIITTYEANVTSTLVTTQTGTTNVPYTASVLTLPAQNLSYIDASTYEKTIIMFGQSDASLATITNMLNDDDYEYLAIAANYLINGYFDELRQTKYGTTTISIPDGQGGSINSDVVPYSYDSASSTITYGVGENTISSTTNIQNQIINNKDALKNTNNVINRIVTNNCAGLVAKGALSASTNAASVMGTAIKDLFSDDLMSVDTEKFSQAFNFDMDEDELSRIMEAMLTGTDEKSYNANLIELGYQDIDDPSSISFYFSDFEAKENFLDFLDNYNEGKDEEDQISYTDITGILMSSVKTIVDSVSYVLIAFVSISLVVSSIMIGVITLISVMERTKEIGILRAMGASKRNVSSIFNAETFIIGLLSGLIGIGFTYAVIPPINKLIHNLTNNYDINAVLPTKYAIILVMISVCLTIIAGIIPSKKAAKQDPVIALRTE